MPGNTNYDLKLFGSMLRPSVFSGFLCVITSITIVAAIATLTNYQGSSFQQDIIQSRTRAENQAILNEDYDYLADDFEQNVLLDKAPVMVFWMFVGTLVYFLVTGITGAIANASELNDELHYIHARRKELLREVYIKTAVRFIVLGVWLGFILLFFKTLLPYSLAAAHVGAGALLSVQGIGYLVLAVIILSLSFHVHVIMLRLVALKPRILSQETSF